MWFFTKVLFSGLLHIAVLAVFIVGQPSADITGSKTKRMLIAASIGPESGLKSMPLGMQTSIPIGHYEFCKAFPIECSFRTSKPQVIELTKSLWKTLLSINNEVNHAINPKADSEVYGKDEVWTFPQGSGDCEDFVLEKRRQLITAGWPASALLITVARKPDDEGHAVLTVRTTTGDFILDNLTGKVLRWDSVIYHFVKRIDAKNSKLWVNVIDERYIEVANAE